MNVLVSTTQAQGYRANDFSFTTEGELLIFNILETDCARDLDDSCGCGRAMCGMDSLKATTTMTVRDMPISEDEYRTAILDSVTRSGWNSEEVNLDALYDALTYVAAHFQPGQVVEYRGGEFCVRATGNHPAVGSPTVFANAEIICK